MCSFVLFFDTVINTLICMWLAGRKAFFKGTRGGVKYLMRDLRWKSVIISSQLLPEDGGGVNVIVHCPVAPPPVHALMCIIKFG